MSSRSPSVEVSEGGKEMVSGWRPGVTLMAFGLRGEGLRNLEEEVLIVDWEEVEEVGRGGGGESWPRNQLSEVSARLAGRRFVPTGRLRRSPCRQSSRL